MILGIDPGASGAIAAVNAIGALEWVHDMPHHDGVVSPSLVADLFHGPITFIEAWVEDVHSMPKQGVASSFKFGRAHGTVLGVLGGLRIPTHLITPAKWKRQMGVPADKKLARRKACELWPDNASLFARVKDDGRAEAALIAEYGRRVALAAGRLTTPLPRHPWEPTAHGGN